jgi:hypothetical protein
MTNDKIRLNIGGAFAKRTQLIPYIFKNKKILQYFNLTVYDGINSCSWNGGRINRDISYDDDIINFYYRNKINIALTFTNPIINLNDTTGNHLLEKFHVHGNSIISVNDQLRKYIKKNYPKYKHIRSITSFGNIDIPMSDSDLDRYKSLEKDYDYIVPRMEHVFDERFEQLNMRKYEIMVNDTCIYGCPYYKDHFEQIALQNRLYKKPWSEADSAELRKVEECWLPNFDPCVGHLPTVKKYGENYGMDLTIKQMNKLIGRGISNFKITGREMTSEQYEGELNNYLMPLYESLDINSHG